MKAQIIDGGIIGSTSICLHGSGSNSRRGSSSRQLKTAIKPTVSWNPHRRMRLRAITTGFYATSTAGTSYTNARKLGTLCSRPHCAVRPSSLGTSRRGFFHGRPLPAMPIVRQRNAAQAKQRNGSDEADASGDIDASVMAEWMGIAWAPVSLSLFGFGFVLGPLLDGIHGTVSLLTYDTASFDVGGLHSSLLVPPLLAVFYTVLGGLANAADAIQQQQGRDIDGGESPYGQMGGGNGDTATADAIARCTPGFVALSVGTVAALLELSAVLYKSGSVPYSTIAAILALGGAANWAAVDRTRQGLALCALCAIAAPLSEVVIVRYLGWWHYNAPDVLGLPSWVPWCYFFYAPSVVNLARWLNSEFTSSRQQQQ